jgi:hypothetical protein
VTKKVGSNIFLIVGTLLTTFILLEVIANFMVTPSPDSSGRFLDVELPPMNVLPTEFAVGTETDRESLEDQWYKRLIVKGRKITRGDLWGIYREDPLIGYVPKESSISANGWWQANDLGARARQDLTRKKPPNKKRLLFFGDSYTQGSRVAQEETFQHFINARSSGFEAVNFGVDGYGMAQAYLRYTTLRDQLEYDHVFLVFAPGDGLWRDINVSREIGGNWNSYMIYPRFVIERGRLKLITSPYRNLRELADDNHENVGITLRQHLQAYEAFYFGSGYGSYPLLDWSVMYRLYRAHRLKRDRSRLFASLYDPNSEALQVIQKIIEAMDKEVRENGSRYTLIILPEKQLVRRFTEDDDFRKGWEGLVSYVCQSRVHCLDLMIGFQSVPFDTLDDGYDGSHYGPVANSLIADFILESLGTPTASQ